MFEKERERWSTWKSIFQLVCVLLGSSGGPGPELDQYKNRPKLLDYKTGTCGKVSSVDVG